MSDYDTRFSLPGVADDPATEIGVILMGLGAERLLAGLGTAQVGDDTTSVTLAVDQLRHGFPDALAAAVTEGAARWRGARETLAATDPGGVRSAALRQLWDAATRTVAAAALVDPTLATLGDAERAYLTACWLRRAEVDLCTEEFHDPPEVTP
jgi:hypothetical protein